METQHTLKLGAVNPILHTIKFQKEKLEATLIVNRVKVTGMTR